METISVHPTPRPALLTVLCVLTFIGSGLGVMGNLMSMFISPFMDFLEPSMFNEAFQQLGNNPGDKFVEEMLNVAILAMENIFTISLLKFIFSALSIVGALYMFKMKKIGFYIYITAQVGFLTIGPIILGWNLMVSMSIFFSGFFSLLFIALYAINLKHMS